jgi:hypothetical protein
MIETLQQHRHQPQQSEGVGNQERQDAILEAEFKRGHDGRLSADIPPNAPEQRNAGFAVGEADPAKYPDDQEVGRFSTGQDASEPIEHGCFAEGQEAEPKSVDPDEGFAERGRESSPERTHG